jgi:putative transposase
VRYDRSIHHRRSIRFPTYDYSQAGAYYVTICAHERQLLFEHDHHRRTVSDAWFDLRRRFWFVGLDRFVVMPNHIHGILWIRRRDVGAQHLTYPDNQPDNQRISKRNYISSAENAAPLRRVTPRSLGAIVRSFKAVAAKRINRARRTPGAPVWQRNYYERVIRDDEELARIRQYIIDNPAKWAEDKNNPANLTAHHP